MVKVVYPRFRLIIGMGLHPYRKSPSCRSDFDPYSQEYLPPDRGNGTYPPQFAHSESTQEPGRGDPDDPEGDWRGIVRSSPARCRRRSRGNACLTHCPMPPLRQWMGVEERWPRWTARRTERRPRIVRRPGHLREEDGRRAQHGRNARAGC